MKIAVSGSTGLVGAALTKRLRNDDHEIIPLVRRNPDENSILWDSARQEIDEQKLGAVDAVVHLAGEPIASGRWTVSRKQRIRDSRVEGTRLLCETIARNSERPKTLIAASAIGYYGNRGDEVCDENSEPGSEFLSNVCREWEAATEPARDAGVRVVNLRIGLVLSGHGGALQSMLPLFKLGLGGKLGSGNQYMSWIALPDLVNAIEFCLHTADATGPINGVAPEPITNAIFTKALGRALGRPTIIPVPSFALRLALGEMAEALLLASNRVVPRRLLELGFSYELSNLDHALAAVLKRDGDISQ